MSGGESRGGADVVAVRAADRDHEAIGADRRITSDRARSRYAEGRRTGGERRGGSKSCAYDAERAPTSCQLPSGYVLLIGTSATVRVADGRSSRYVGERAPARARSTLPDRADEEQRRERVPVAAVNLLCPTGVSEPAIGRRVRDVRRVSASRARVPVGSRPRPRVSRVTIEPGHAATAAAIARSTVSGGVPGQEQSVSRRRRSTAVGDRLALRAAAAVATSDAGQLVRATRSSMAGHGAPVCAAISPRCRVVPAGLGRLVGRRVVAVVEQDAEDPPPPGRPGRACSRSRSERRLGSPRPRAERIGVLGDGQPGSIAHASGWTGAQRLGRLTTMPSWLLRAITTTASSSPGFSSRCGTNGGTNT